MSDGGEVSRHVEQTIPKEWSAFDIGDRQIVAHDRPEGGVRCYVASTTTRNLRLLAKADRVLFDGEVLDPHYDSETKSVVLQHTMGGRRYSGDISGFLDEPAVRLRKLPEIDPAELVS